jgi:hypothetical protein
MLVGLLAGVAIAQEEPDVEFDPLNFAFAAYAGSGIYQSSNGTVYLFRIPISYGIVSPEKHPVGVRLRIQATLGFYNFDPNDLIDLIIPDQVGTISVLAGVELPIPIYEKWVLGPFVDYGPAWDSETDDLSWVLGGGIRSRAFFPWKSRQFVLWNELVVASNRGDDDVERDDFGKFLAELEYRQPLNLTIRGMRTAIGPFVKAEYVFDGLEFQTVSGESRDIRHRYEVGVKFSTAEREKIWIVPIPRVGLSYRFGDGVDSVRLIFSSRFLDQVSVRSVRAHGPAKQRGVAVDHDARRVSTFHGVARRASQPRRQCWVVENPVETIDQLFLVA